MAADADPRQATQEGVAMDVLGLTSYSQIRAVLTVSPEDLPDETMRSYGVEDDLELELTEWLPDWEAISDDKQELHLRLFAKYFCAASIGTTASIFVLTQSSDGENAGQRSPGDTQKVIAELMNKASVHKAELLKNMGGTETSYPSFMSISKPSRDVITEGR